MTRWYERDWDAAEADVREVHRLRDTHPAWSVWHQSDARFRGWYAVPRGCRDRDQVIRRDTAAELDEALHARDTSCPE